MLKQDFIIYFCIIVVWALNDHEPFKTMWRWFKIFLLVLIGTLMWDNIKKFFSNK